MGLKQIINKQKLMEAVVDGELVLPGEPLIYSIKYELSSSGRQHQFRNSRWKSMLKCHFRSFYNTKTPVVVVVKFFVSPPESESVSPKTLSTQKTPATRSYELCDYLLSFLEMLHHVLINSYRQVVKIDAVKEWHVHLC